MRIGIKQYLFHMPGLNVALMLSVARQRFSGFRLHLPTVVGGAAPPLLASAMGAAGPGSRAPAPVQLFQAASGDTRDLEMQRLCNNVLDNYLVRLCDAIGQAHTAWRQRATLVGVRINASIATGGNLQAAGLTTDIRSRAPQETRWQRSRTEAIAAGIGCCFENWQRSVTVPGMPWYPAFVAFPAPVAPPMPNTPVPLVALTQNSSLLNCIQLKYQMQLRYSGDGEWAGELLDSVGTGFERAFKSWTPAQMIVNVLGTGPIPTFAPPYVPVGPVVGGTGTQMPGAWSV